MPLVIVAGHPCSGKTTTAQALLALAINADVQAHLISENDVCPDRVESYSCAPRPATALARPLRQRASQSHATDVHRALQL